MPIDGWGLVIDTAPTVEPVSLDEAKTHLRVTDPDDDTYITNLIKAARGAAEAFTRRAFITQTLDLALDRFPLGIGEPIVTPRPNLISVTSIVYNDQNGDSQTWSSSKYTVDIKNKPGRIFPAFNEVYPTTRGHVNDVTVKFVAGYGAAADVPESVRQAILLIIGHLYNNRENTIIGTNVAELPQGAEPLLWPERVMGF